jgi:hypothetical protein
MDKTITQFKKKSKRELLALMAATNVIGPNLTKPTRFLEVGDLQDRWGVSRQTIERWWRRDPNFPVAHRFADSRVRKFAEADVENYERAAMTKRGGVK